MKTMPTTKELYAKCVEVCPDYPNTDSHKIVEDDYDMGFFTSDERYFNHISEMVRIYGEITFKSILKIEDK